MSRLTAPRRADFYQGSNPTFFVTRYKSDLGNHTPAVTDIGTATDRGYDPAITSIPTTVSGTTGVCSLPTDDWWSAQVGGMVFMVDIENNNDADLTVDLEFYRAVYGDTGGVENWELIETREGVAADDPAIIIGETAGSSVFVRVAGITNPDNDAQLYIQARLASSAEIASCGADSEVGSNVVGVKGWYATTRNWLGILVDGSGRVVTSSGAAIAGYVKKISDEVTTGDGLKVMQDDASKLLNTELNSTTILARLTSLVTTIGNHGVATDTEGIRVLGVADSTTPTAVGDGEDVHPWNNLVGARGVFQTQGSDHTTSSISTFEEPGSGIDSVIKDCAAADTAYALVAASTPCIGVFLSAAQANAGQARFGDSAIAAVATGGAYIPHDDVSAPVWVSIDDAAKLYVSASNNGDDVIATIITR